MSWSGSGYHAGGHVIRRAGLSAQSTATLTRARIGTDKTTGLPVILGGRPAKPGDELTPERVADILNEQEAEWSRDPR